MMSGTRVSQRRSDHAGCLVGGTVLEGVRLIALFDLARVVPVAIRRIDLIKHEVILESPQES
jgi:hypothetical protein